MKIYFSSRAIPELAHLSISDRLLYLNQAAKKLSVPEKTLLNIFKLMVIVPAFALVLRTASDWTSILWAALIIMSYPFIVRPMQFTFAAKYLPKNIKEPM